jgi:hypothetical protein
MVSSLHFDLALRNAALLFNDLAEANGETDRYEVGATGRISRVFPHPADGRPMLAPVSAPVFVADLARALADDEGESILAVRLMDAVLAKDDPPAPTVDAAVPEGAEQRLLEAVVADSSRVLGVVESAVREAETLQGVGAAPELRVVLVTGLVLVGTPGSPVAGGLSLFRRVVDGEPRPEAGHGWLEAPEFIPASAILRLIPIDRRAG